MSSADLPNDLSELSHWLTPRLLHWYAENRRALPWRIDRDPYRIWVSEVMLQQTQVSTVVAYYQRFLARFPNLVDLAHAEQQEVLHLWQGLGYYRRARDLLRAAQLLLERHNGVFPADPQALVDLPGLGQYTRNAVLSQAFDLRLPIVEANSERVLSRFFGRTEDPRRTKSRRWLWQAAEALLPTSQVGEFNQAMMELGALVCTPTSPACDRCPLSPRCLARQSGRPESYPQKARAKAVTVVEEVAVILRHNGAVLLAQRQAQATRWANLWEFPHLEVRQRETQEQALARLLGNLGVQAQLRGELATIQHQVTRFRIRMVAFEADFLSGEFRSEVHSQGCWVAIDRLTEYPVSSPQRRLIQQLLEPGRQQKLF